MSESTPSPTDGAGSRRPQLSLPIWVVVVLLLTFFSSCSAASSASDAADSARSAVNIGTPDLTGSVGQDDLTDLCSLLGAVAVKEGLDLDTVLGPDGASECRTGAYEGAGR